MALQTQIQPGHTRFAGLPRAGDRAKAFRSAQRHSAAVKLLRWLFPVAAICVAGLYFMPSKLTIETDLGTATVDDVTLSEGGLKMINPRIKGVHDKHGVYDIQADHATQHVENTELITLDTITAELVSKAGEKTSFTAPSGIFHSKKEELTFNNGVTIAGNAGFSGKLKTATAFLQHNKLISTDPVELGFHNSTIKARSMTFYSSEGRAIFEGNVRVHLEREPEGSRK